MIGSCRRITHRPFLEACRVEVRSLHSLRALCLRGSTAATDYTITSVGYQCQELVSLDLGGGGDHVSSTSLDIVLEFHCTTLRRLDISSTSVDDHGLSVLGQRLSSSTNNLQFLDLSHLSFRDATGAALLGTSITELRLAGNDLVTGALVKETLFRCRNLLSLDLRDCCHVDDSAFG